MKAMERLLEIMVRLRDPEDGCPWDDFVSEGTADSLRKMGEGMKKVSPSRPRSLAEGPVT